MFQHNERTGVIVDVRGEGKARDAMRSDES